MRILRSHLHDIGPFTDLELDIESTEGTVVAVRAANGVGKTTALEVTWLGTCYRDTETQGSLLARATSRDAYLETDVDMGGGNVYRIRHTVDAVGKKGESIVVRLGDTEPLWKGAGVSKFDDWAARNLLDRDILTSTMFAVQKASGFIGLGSAARISVILKAVGVARIERMAKLARNRKSKTEVELKTLGFQIAEVRRTAPDLDAAVAEQERLSELVEELAGKITCAQESLNAARAMSTDSVLARARYREQCEARKGLFSSISRAQSDLRNVTAHLTTCQPDQIRTDLQHAEVRQRELEHDLAAATTTATDLRSRREAAERQAAERNRMAKELYGAKGSKDSIAVRIANNRKVLDKADEIRAVIAAREAAVAELPDLEQAEAAAKLAVSEVESRLDLLRAQRLVGAEGRIVGLRAGLIEISDIDLQERPAYVAIEIADFALRDDDKVVAAATEHPARLKAAELEVSQAKTLQAKVTAARVACSSRSVATHQHEPILATAEARIAELTLSFEEAKSAVEQLTAELAALPEPSPVPADPDLAGLRRSYEDAAQRVRRLGEELARAEATCAQLEPRLEQLQVGLVELEAQLEAMPVPVAPGEEPNQTALEQTLQSDQDKKAEALRQYGAIDQRIEAATAAKKRLEELATEEQALVTELSDWTRLCLDLGRDGIQSTEVDSAGPELTELANDLLLQCAGPRYTVSIETKRATGNGKGTTDECRVMVRDGKDNSERESREHSGGECVVLGEAVSLALMMMACSRSGVHGAVIVRDESGAALDPENARTYVAMLRHAAKFVHASKVLLVSHSPDVQAMADSVIEIKRTA
jgi:exonuclease SbcC